jgi:acetyltransferase-like isoleucine patch superfamily enzyme
MAHFFSSDILFRTCSGSRSCIFCTTTDSCENIVLCAGSNVADNCVVLPNTIVGKNAVLGSNSLCPEGWYIPEGSVWFGSKGCEPTCLEKGPENQSGKPMSTLGVNRSKLQMVGDASTLRPFGKAFYERKSTYFVWPLSWIVGATFIIKLFVAVFHALPLLLSLHGAAAVIYGIKVPLRHYSHRPHRFATIYFAVLYVYFWLNILRILLWLAIELSAKWLLLGRRKVGRYNYDSSSYAQRWELYQLIGKIRRFSRFSFLQFIFGTPYMASYFRWNGCKIGKNCCLFPTGLSLMPEPDLVTLGDSVVIDSASIVCHLNTRGNFELAKIVVEDNCTLRARSRIQQGVYMESGSQLLEKTLVMTGEIVEKNSVWQGGPASWWFEHSTTPTSVPFAADEEDESVGETSTLLTGRPSSYYGA